MKKNPHAVILTNIHVNTKILTNVRSFGDGEFLEALKDANKINDEDRAIYMYPQKKSPLPFYERSKFRKIYIFFDEAGAIQNSRAWKDFDLDGIQYLNQNRKMNTNIYTISPESTQIESSIRRFAEWNLFCTKFLFLNDIKILKMIKRKKDGSPAMEPYISRDSNGDYCLKEKPMIKTIGWFWQPGLFNLYDDWHKNIKIKFDVDKEKKI
jgi:hypothetical protein